MKKKLLVALNIEKGEEKRVFLLLLQSFFIGVFIATYENIAVPIFNEAFGGSESMDGLGLAISGVIGIIFGTIYAKLQSKIKFSSLAFFNLALVALMVLALSLSLEFSDNKWLKFTVFIMIGPFIVTSLLGFWGVAGRLFNLRQGKRLFGLVDTGMILGMIVISLTIPFIQEVFTEKKYILFISSISCLVASIVQLRITTKFRKDLNQVTKLKEGESDRLSWKELFKNAFTRTLSLFVTFSMMAAFFIWLSYNRVAKINYPDESTLVSFFFLFYAIVMFITLLMKTFLYGRVLKTYGLKVTLVSISLIVLIFAILAAVLGTVLGIETGENFIVFFLVIALVRLLSQSLKLAIEGPAQKLFFQPLDKKIRYDAQAKIEGVINEFAGILAGALLSVIFHFFNLLVASYILVGILTVWLFLGIKLYKEYQNRLKSSLKNVSTSESVNQENAETLLEKTIKSNMNRESHRELLYSLSLTEKLEPIAFEQYLIDFLQKDNDDLKRVVIDKIKEKVMIQLLPQIQKIANAEQDEKWKNVYTKLIEDYLDLIKKNNEYHLIKSLVRSKNKTDKILATRLITHNYNEEYKELFLEVYRDIDPDIRIILIQEIARLKLKQFYYLIVEALSNERFTLLANAAILRLKDDIIDPLEHAFQRSGLSSEHLMKIAKIYGEIGTKKAQKVLEQKISYPDRHVVIEVLHSLKKCGYEADASNRNKIHLTIDAYISNIAWFMAAKEKLNHEDIRIELMVAIDKEIQQSYALLYLLLSLAYDANSIASIKENIDNGTTESISYAIELLDLFIVEDLKPKLFTLLEEAPIDDKLNGLQNIFPRENLDETETLVHILNRDYNLTGRWTKFTALLALNQIPDLKISKDIIAQLFNPDVLLHETAAWLIFNKDPKLYKDCIKRLPKEIKTKIEKKIYWSEKGKNELIVDRMNSLKKIDKFQPLEDEVLSNFATVLEKVNYRAGDIVLKDKKKSAALYIVINGLVNLIEGDKHIETFGPEQIFGEMNFLFFENQIQFHAETDVELFYISSDAFLRIISLHPEIYNVVINLLNQEKVTV